VDACAFFFYHACLLQQDEQHLSKTHVFLDKKIHHPFQCMQMVTKYLSEGGDSERMQLDTRMAVVKPLLPKWVSCACKLCASAFEVER